MSKLTPIILAAIMLASTSLVALDWTELEERKTTEADGRTGPDAKVTDILSPRETTISALDGTMQHTIDSGESVHFDMYIENVGDTDITEMGISLTIYLEEGGQRGLVAKDLNGNDLSWNNGDVVCDDAFVCPWTTIASNDTLNYGRYTFAYQGSPVTWTPTTGDYIIVVTTNAVGDADVGNDEMERRVSVVDWTDIVVDLEWTSGKEVETGGGNKDFKLTVSTDGSRTWSARNVTLQLDVSGTIDSATETQGGTDILGITQVSDIGTYGMAETFRHEEDDTNVTNESRYVIDFEDSFEWFGTILPDSEGQSGDYSISVNLVSYVVYDQQPECEETVLGNATGNATGGELEDVTYIHFCEVEYNTDSNAATSEDMLEGQIQTFHDIGISDLVINQGYELDENNMPITEASMPGMTEGPLNPVWSSVQATVVHLGSELTSIYDWEVEFEITNTVTGQVTTQTANDCMYNPGDDYFHMKLGDDMGMGEASAFGLACVLFEFVPGIYNVTATISMVNATVTDQSARNDAVSMYNLAALNNRPTVSITVEQEENSIIVGPESVLTLVADAYDADDEFGETLSYVWTHPEMISFNGTLEPSPCDGIGPQFSVCPLNPSTSAWANVNSYSVTVYDLYGSSSMDFVNVFVWNHILTGASSASGIGMEYNLTYNGINEFSVSLVDSSKEYTKDLTDFGYAGEYNSVAVLDYTPSTTYLSEDVLEQTITMSYDTSTITPTSVFWVSSNGVWEQLDATITEAGADGTIALEYGQENTQTLAGGEIVLMGGELQLIETPTANPTDLTVIASKGGMISASWSYSGNAVPGLDYLVLEICDSNDVCTTTQENTTLVAHLMSGQTDTTHGETYTYTLQVCNIGGCNPTIATDSATADKMVDGDVTATGMSVEPGAEANTWTIKWDVDGDTSDVAGWKVCMADYSWSAAGEMPECIADAGDATSVDVPHPQGTGTKTYYFAAVPYDDKGNMENALPGTDTVLVHANTIVDPCEEDPSSAECAAIGDSGDSADSGEVPTWTWGVIIGLVVVAFVVGAFILSRGGDGDDGKDWDY